MLLHLNTTYSGLLSLTYGSIESWSRIFAKHLHDRIFISPSNHNDHVRITPESALHFLVPRHESGSSAAFISGHQNYDAYSEAGASCLSQY
jgi:hypothetical protein